MKEYSIEDIEKMVDALPNSPLKRIAKQAMKAVDKAGISKKTKIIDADEYHPPTGRNTPFDHIDPDLDLQVEHEVKMSEERIERKYSQSASEPPAKVFHLTDEDVVELLKKQDKENDR
jgi:hypothetical protein